MKKIFTVQDKYNEYNVGCSLSEDIAKEIAAEADKRYPYGAPHSIINESVYESLDEYVQITNDKDEKRGKERIFDYWKNYPLYKIVVKDNFYPKPKNYISYFERSNSWPRTVNLGLLRIPASEYSEKGKRQEIIKRYIIDSVEFLAPPGEFHDDYDVEHFIKNLENKVE